MDKLKKTIELIESHQNPLDHHVVDPGVNLTVKEMFDVLIAEIERLSDLNKAKGALIKAYAKNFGRLLKEKEWYKDKAVEFMLQLWEYDGDIESAEKSLLKEMQQVLKEHKGGGEKG